MARLGAILNRKAEQIAALQGQLAGFAAKLREEEDQSRLVRRMPMWWLLPTRNRSVLLDSRLGLGIPASGLPPPRRRRGDGV